jgi:YD repeat-containing protein
VTASFSYTASISAGCVGHASSSGTITLQPGPHTLYAQIDNKLSETGSGNTDFTYTLNSSRGAVAVTPDAGTRQLPTSAKASMAFSVANAGATLDTFNLAVACTGPSTACSLSRPSVALAAGATATVAVNLTTGTGGTGRIRLIASSPNSDGTTTLDSGWVNVTATAGLGAGLVGDSLTIPGVFRGLCLNFSAGAGAANECGDLRLVYPLPTTAVLNKPRTPVLIYNSDHARPNPVLARYFDPPASLGTPSSVVLTATIVDWPGGAHTLPPVTFPGWAPGTGAARRLALGVDASSLSTGSYRYRLALVANYATGPDTLPEHTGEMVVVNRMRSPFGPGWWLAGLEQLICIDCDGRTPAGSRMLVVGGDGTARIYDPATPNGWTTWTTRDPSGASDTLALSSTIPGIGTGYIRKLRGGGQIIYDGAGRHVRSENALGQQTNFGYNAGGNLSTITLPRGGLMYQFGYGTVLGGPILQSVQAPSLNGETRSVLVRWDPSGRVTRIIDPGSTSADSNFIAFGYGDATARVTRRTDRRGYLSEYRYNAAGRVSSSKLHMNLGGGGDSIVVRYPYIAQLRGLSSMGGSVAATSVFTRVEGPRTAPDSLQQTTFYVDRYGSPTRIKDVRGNSTYLYREDPRFPALVTRVIAQNGRTLTASYDGHGNLTSQTDWSTHIGAQYATATFDYDLKWDAARLSISPSGIVTQTQYDAATGRPLWTQTGADSTRATFGYDPSTGLLNTIYEPGAPAPSRMEYDPALGNLSATVSPLGFRTDFFRDAVGRLTSVFSPTDSLQTSALRVEQRAYFDHWGRDSLAVTITPALGHEFAPAQTLSVQTLYDRSGNPLSVRRWGTPVLSLDHPASIVRSYEYDAAGRKTAEIDEEGHAERYVYNVAGDVTSLQTRDAAIILMRYDVFGRLIRRETPARHGDAWFDDRMDQWLPREQAGYTTPAQIDTFAYDLAGNMVSADNPHARIRRVYNQNGSLASDSTVLRSWDEPGSWTMHSYVTRFGYDLEGCGAHGSSCHETLHQVPKPARRAIASPIHTTL